MLFRTLGREVRVVVSRRDRSPGIGPRAPLQALSHPPRRLNETGFLLERSEYRSVHLLGEELPPRLPRGFPIPSSWEESQSLSQRLREDRRDLPFRESLLCV